MGDRVILPGAENLGNEARRVIASEMEALRQKEATLPRIAQHLQLNKESNVTKLAAMAVPEKAEHPGNGTSKVSQDFLNRLAAAQRGAMLGAGSLKPQSAKRKKQNARKAQRNEAKPGTEEEEEEEVNEGSKNKLLLHPASSTSTLPQGRRGHEHKEAQGQHEAGRVGPPGGIHKPADPHKHAPWQDGGLRTSLPEIKLNNKASAPPRKMSIAATGRIGGRYKGRRQARAMQRRRGGGVRADSRVGKLLAEFKTQEDWVSQTILRHRLATILQANVKGWLARKRWAGNCQNVVDNLHKQIEAETVNQERRANLRKQLEDRKLKGVETEKLVNLLFNKEKKRAQAQKAHLTVGSKWGKLQTALNANHTPEPPELKNPRAKDAPDPDLGGSDSEFSDLEMEDIATVKLRATTPPWQRMEEAFWIGQYNKLGKKNTRAAIEASWDLNESNNRLLQARERRMERNPDGDDFQKGGMNGAFDPTTQKLSNERVHELLYPAYMKRFARMGLLDYNPLDLPPSMADQGCEDQLEDEESLQDEHELRPNQDKTPEALAAELDFPVAARLKRPGAMAAHAARTKEMKQEVVGKMDSIMQQGLKQSGRRPSYASGSNASLVA